MVRIALPVINGVLSGHFGHCNEFFIYDVDNYNITNEIVIVSPPHEPGMLPAWLAKRGVTDIIAGGMGQRAICLFNQNKINVFIGVPIKPPKELVADYIEGTLETSDNTCEH